MSYTPGPWVWRAIAGGWDGVVSDEGMICNLSLNNPENARLIAAAPDLLEAGKARIDALGGLLVCYRVGKQPTEELHAKLKRSEKAWAAAIAKADAGS